MPNVYLDTSHFSVLASARILDPEAFKLFTSLLRARNVTLAISRVHVVELRRHDDPVVRAQRYALLHDLTPIKSDAASQGTPDPARPLSMSEREILGTLRAEISAHATDLEIASKIRDATRIAFLTEAFPIELATGTEVAALQSYESQEFRGLIDLVHSGVQGATDSRTRAPLAPRVRTRLKDLSPDPISADELATREAAFDAILADGLTRLQFEGALPKGELRNLLAGEIQRLRDMSRRVAEVGLRRAWAEAHGIADIHAAGARFADEIAHEHFFRRSVAGVAHDVLDIEPDRAEQIALTVRLMDCPGTWLARQVDIESETAEPEPSASNAYDLDHLVYMPYVDYFFADKRIAGYTSRILKRGGAPPVFATCHAPMTTSRSIQSLIDVVEQDVH